MDISDLLNHSPTRAPGPFAPTTVAVHAPAIPTSTPAAPSTAEQQQITSPGARKYNQWSHGRYICSTCNKAFWYFCHLKRHRRAHMGEKPFHCDHVGCGKAFNQCSSLRKHQRIHTGEKPFHCDHVGCGKAFRRRDHLHAHLRTHKEPFHCDSVGCGEALSAS